MKPRIDGTSFGSITIDGEEYNYDVVIDASGKVHERQKKLSRQVTGTSHIVSREEVKHLLEQGANQLIIGTGQSGVVRLSDEAAAYLQKKSCAVTLAATPEAIGLYKAADEPVTAMFHLTC
jgi:hypothetical protein